MFPGFSQLVPRGLLAPTPIFPKVSSEPFRTVILLKLMNMGNAKQTGEERVFLVFFFFFFGKSVPVLYIFPPKRKKTQASRRNDACLIFAFLVSLSKS